MKELGKYSAADTRPLEYQTIKAISASFLTAYECKLEGKEQPRFYAAAAMKVGSEVHRLILEPETKCEETFDTSQIKKIRDMSNGLRNNKALTMFLADEATLTEQPIHAVVNIAGYDIPLKGIADIINHTMKEMIDIKTTSAKSMKQFMTSCVKFNYFSQALIYKMITGYQLTIIGVNHSGSIYYVDTGHEAFAEQRREAATRVNDLIEIYIMENGINF